MTPNTSDSPTSTNLPSAHVESYLSVSAGRTSLVTVTETLSPSTQSTPDLSTTNNDSTAKSHVAAIVAGTVGGVMILAVAVFLLLLRRRKKIANENRRATLPPMYTESNTGGDMSAQLPGTSPVKRCAMLLLASH